MKCPKSIRVKTIIEIDGRKYIRKEQDWTSSISQAIDRGETFNNHEDIIYWIESDLFDR